MKWLSFFSFFLLEINLNFSFQFRFIIIRVYGIYIKIGCENTDLKRFNIKVLRKILYAKASFHDYIKNL